MKSKRFLPEYDTQKVQVEYTIVVQLISIKPIILNIEY